MTPPKRLLYAEDDDMLRGALSELLTLIGWQVTCEPDGSAALARAKIEDFDVILTDHHMPVKDGLELVQSLRTQGFSGRIYVISGGLKSEHVDQYLRLHVDGIVAKPIALAQLRTLLPAA